MLVTLSVLALAALGLGWLLPAREGGCTADS